MERIGWAAAAFLFLAVPLHAEDAMYRVVDVVGSAEVLPVSGSWVTLEKGAEMAAGMRLRTGPDGLVDLVRDAYFENTMRVGPSSVVAFLNVNPVRLSLDAGSVYVLKEDGHEIRVLTRDFLISMREGGFRLDATALKVFAESARIFRKTPEGYSNIPETVDEGFEFTTAGSTRLDYQAYLDWKVWYKKNEERKDSAGLG